MSEEVDFFPAVGTVWLPKDYPKDIVVDEGAEQISNSVISYLTSDNPRSVMVTGEQGVGKTTLIDIVAKKLSKKGWNIVTAVASDLVAGQRYIGDLEQQVKTFIHTLLTGGKVLWIAPRFHELYFTGRHEYSPVGIIDHIFPYLDKGQIRVLGEIQTHQYEKLIRFRPGLRSAMETVRLESESHAYAQGLAEKWCKTSGRKKLWGKVKKGVLKEAGQLVNQYIHEAEPGNLIDFLKQVEFYLESIGKPEGPVTPESFIGTLSALTGIPETILDDEKRLDLQELEQKFTSRVIGQDEAVNVLTERIAMIKAGLTDPGRPAGVFLFVGPTGTGKTEIAKALAEFLFGSDEKLIRIDMSEMQSFDSMSRLIGDGSQTSESSSLVNQIRETPFSVILLDEFEKAHPRIWDLFLQVFDDGRLTDPSGNTADFRHAIIIMTSNLGAGIPIGSSIGFNPDEDSPEVSDKFQKVLEGTFRPEFINRIDRIVNFRPLDRATLRKILKKELKNVLQRRAFRQRQWQVEWEDSALDFLMEKGYTINLGARPMKRAIEQYLLAPLAITIVNHQFPEGDQFLFVRRSGNGLKVDFVDPEEPKADWKGKKKKIENQKKKAEKLSMAKIAFDPKGNLAERTAIIKAFSDGEKEINSRDLAGKKAELMEEMNSDGFWERPNKAEVLSDIEFIDRLESAWENTGSLINRIRDEGKKVRMSFPPEIIGRIATRIFLIEKALEAFEKNEEQDCFLRIYLDLTETPQKEAYELAEKLEEMYRNWAKKRKMRLFLVKEPSDDNLEMIFSITGFGARQILENESGIHVLETPAGESNFHRHRVRVEVAPMPEIPGSREEALKMAIIQFGKLSRDGIRVVRRYREEPSPLVRDNIMDWRSGKPGKIFGGDFDLPGEF